MRHEWTHPNRFTGEPEKCVVTDGNNDAPELGEEWAYYGFADKDDPAALEIRRLAARVQELEGAEAFASEALEDRDRIHRALNDASDRIAALEEENRRLREAVGTLEAERDRAWDRVLRERDRGENDNGILRRAEERIAKMGGRIGE